MIDVDAAEPRTPRTHRRRWTVGAVAVVAALAAVAALLVLRNEDAKYGPVGYGGFGVLAGAPHIVSDDGGFGRYRLTTTGAQTTFAHSSLANDGDHVVTITGVDPDSITVRAQWAPMPTSEDVAIPDVNARWRDFPAEVDGYIQVRYEIRRPMRCQDEPMTPGSGSFYTDSHTVHWESLLSDHTTTVSGVDDDLYVQVC